MSKGTRENFGAEIAKMLPALMREIAKKQDTFLMNSDLPVPGLLVLDLLREQDAATMSEISKVLHLSMSSATGIIDKMIEQGYVSRERSEEDRRVVNVILAEKGSKAAKDVNKERVDMMNDLYAVLTDNEQEEYIRLLKKVYEGVLKRNEEIS